MDKGISLVSGTVLKRFPIFYVNRVSQSQEPQARTCETALTVIPEHPVILGMYACVRTLCFSGENLSLVNNTSW